MSVVPRLSDPALLAAWEAGAHRRPAERALALAAAGDPASGRPELEALSPGRRDACLFDLHAATFGAELAGLVACPDCAEQLEVAFHRDDVRAGSGDPLAEHQLVVEETGHRVVFRVPDSGAVAAAAAHGDLEEARLALVERCVVRAEQAGRQVPAGSLPEAVVGALSAGIRELDPQADVRLAMRCPACGHQWSALFDVADFLWREVDARARALLAEVAALAAAFGWSEHEILGLSEARRLAYLELAGA
jgi:uncharacterized protein (UPF0212 family)